MEKEKDGMTLQVRDGIVIERNLEREEKTKKKLANSKKETQNREQKQKNMETNQCCKKFFRVWFLAQNSLFKSKTKEKRE